MNQPEKLSPLTLKSVENDDELRIAIDVMASAASCGYVQAIGRIEARGSGYPGYRRDHTRIALWNGEIAGALCIYAETIRLGEARLKTGGIGWVCTVQRHRNKGIASALIVDSLEYMRRHNYHVSMLFGRPEFYQRFRFATALGYYRIAIETREASNVTGTLRMRNIKPGDIPAIQKIHSANDAATACSILRTRGHIASLWDQWKRARVLTNSQGKVLGYFHANRDGDIYDIDEVGLADVAVAPDLLAACAALAHDEAVSEMHFHLPPTHPFAPFLLSCQSARELDFVHRRDGMMGFVNVGEALENLIPEWESLLTLSPLRDARLETTLLLGRDSYRVRANKGAIDIAQTTGTNKVSLTHADLIQLVTGYVHPQDILENTRRMLTPDARMFLETIFPKRHPCVWTLDRF